MAIPAVNCASRHANKLAEGNEAADRRLARNIAFINIVGHESTESGKIVHSVGDSCRFVAAIRGLFPGSRAGAIKMIPFARILIWRYRQIYEDLTVNILVGRFSISLWLRWLSAI